MWNALFYNLKSGLRPNQYAQSMRKSNIVTLLDCYTYIYVVLVTPDDKTLFMMLQRDITKS